MEAYTIHEVMDLLDGSKIDTESDSEIEEDPDFPLPSIESDDNDPVFSSPISIGEEKTFQGIDRNFIDKMYIIKIQSF